MSEMIIIIMVLACVAISFAALHVAHGYDSFADDCDGGWM